MGGMFVIRSLISWSTYIVILVQQMRDNTALCLSGLIFKIM